MFATSTVVAWCKEFNIPTFALFAKVSEEEAKQPEADYLGGNDKDFFSFEAWGKKFFAVRNEVDDLTVMFPEEY